MPDGEINLVSVDKSVEVTQRVEFSCSYLVPRGGRYDLNSVNYKFEATVCGSKAYESTGRVISFEDFIRVIKSILPNKSFIYDKNDDKQKVLAEAFRDCGVFSYVFDGDISAERILEEISLMLVEALHVYPGVYLKETKLRENASSYVSWKQEEK